MRFGIHHGAMAIEISHYLRRRIYDREPNIVNQLFAIRGVSIYVYKSMILIGEANMPVMLITIYLRHGNVPAV